MLADGRGGRVVTSGWRYWRHLRLAPHPALLALLFGALVVTGAIAAALALPTLAAGGGDHGESEVATGVALLLGVPWMAIGAVAAPLLVRVLPDLVRRRSVEGTLVRARRPVGGRGGDSSPAQWVDALYVAVDDGAGGPLVAYPLGRGRPGRLSGTAYDRVATGDRARVTVTPHFGHVVRVEVLHDRHGRPVPPLGVAPPAPPGCPLQPHEVAATYGTGVRGVGPEVRLDGGARSWAFELVADVDVLVRLFVTDAAGLDAVLVEAKAYDPRPARAAGTAAEAVRYGGVPGGLLVVREGDVAVGLQRTSTVDTTIDALVADDRLARLALARLVPARRRGRGPA